LLNPLIKLQDHSSNTCLDQSFLDDTAGLAQNNTPDHQETAHRLYSIIKHQHTIIRAIIHEANKEHS
jgi:hypothetical protein